ncbi:hypothetical protein VIBHAR_02245 [Vibrio campbellii ATCC BAA-1116]|uniref:Uncharacterized protein n=1 Tax=Vibrio campbellii (strain ATCC BAA-1116) TaxID=2902295 RepID=A7MVN7_VIBC1|nr:hypothetical protein VIBHAR_02245 [Vibrio campbellii ATCC BAA-1116]
MLMTHFPCAVNQFAIWVTHSWNQKNKRQSEQRPAFGCIGSLFGLS